jgi:hypothetical protein
VKEMEGRVWTLLRTREGPFQSGEESKHQSTEGRVGGESRLDRHTPSLPPSLPPSLLPSLPTANRPTLATFIWARDSTSLGSALLALAP